MHKDKFILITGATGYVGGRLTVRLLDAGYRFAAWCVTQAGYADAPGFKQVEIVEGDALVPETLDRALTGVSVAYYLIYGMQGNKASAERDMIAAGNFSEAAERANIERIIYLGELVDPAANLSPYLRSRHETGYMLRHGRVSVTEFRAGMIVGSGSVLFEMIRYLSEREPPLICPAWFYSTAQPIAIRDVLSYLIAALETEESVGRMIEIGGSTRLTYAEMVMYYAKERGRGVC